MFILSVCSILNFCWYFYMRVFHCSVFFLNCDCVNLFVHYSKLMWISSSVSGCLSSQPSGFRFKTQFGFLAWRWALHISHAAWGALLRKNWHWVSDRSEAFSNFWHVLLAYKWPRLLVEHVNGEEPGSFLLVLSGGGYKTEQSGTTPHILPAL